MSRSTFSLRLVAQCMAQVILGVMTVTVAATSSAARVWGHEVLLQGNGRLVILNETGEITWERQWGGLHDLHEMPNGNFLVLRGKAEVCEIDRETKKVVWSYDASKMNGNRGKPVEVHACQPLEDDRVMIVETTTGRIIEVDREGNILKEVPLKVENSHPHTDTRLARKLDTGNYLVAHEADGAVREYDGDSGELVWEYEVPLFGKAPAPGHGPEAFGNKVFSALRLDNGNTLIATGNGHSVLEVSPEKEIVWHLSQHDLTGITLAWVTTLEVLPNGNYVIGNCHAGPGNPLLIEIDPSDKQVAWTLDRFDDFGNSVSNSKILDGKE